MFQTILAQVIQESAESTQRLLTAVPALPHQEVWGLLEILVGNIKGLQSAWEAVKEQMTTGIESLQLQTAIEKILQAAEAEERLARLLFDRGECERSTVKVEELRQALAELESIQQAGNRMLAWLRVPRCRWDAQLLEQSRLDFERGNYESGEDILARLQAGGDL